MKNWSTVIRMPIKAGVALALLGQLATTCWAISTQAQWDARFDSLYRNRAPLLDITNANEDGTFAWNAHYWVRAYVTMGRTFEDPKYAQFAEQLIDFMLYNRDDARNARGALDITESPYIAAPAYYLEHRSVAAPGWRSFDGYYNGWRLYMHENAQILQAIMHYVNMVMTGKAFATFRPKAQSYIRAVEETVQAFDSSFAYNRFPNIPGSYYYPAIDGNSLHEGAVEYNMNAVMGTTLLLLDKVKGKAPAYRKKVQAIIGYFLAHVQLESDNAYVWSYHPQKPWIGVTDSGIEDFNHGHMDVGFHILAYQRGIGFNSLDMQRFANTLVKRIDLGDGELSWSVDGREMDASKNYWPIGFDWISLSEFNPKVLTIATTVYTKYYRKPGWSRPFLGWANILYWERRLHQP